MRLASEKRQGEPTDGRPLGPALEISRRVGVAAQSFSSDTPVLAHDARCTHINSFLVPW
jgi:hypothetical protein